MNLRMTAKKKVNNTNRKNKNIKTLFRLTKRGNDKSTS